MQAETPQLDISRIVDAPRDLVYRAFTDPEHFAAWWGPVGNSLPRDEMDFDVRPGGHQRWTELSAADPGVRVHVSLDLTDVAHGELLDGLMHIAGRLPEGIAPFETRVRIEFYDEAVGRTRLEIRQWLPAHQAGNARQGWRESLGKLDAALLTTTTESSETEPSTTGEQ